VALPPSHEAGGPKSLAAEYKSQILPEILRAKEALQDDRHLRDVIFLLTGSFAKCKNATVLAYPGNRDE
jgi:hypothetical protein